MDKDGVSDFSALIKAVHKKSDAIAFVAFDILHIDGIDLRKEPLIRRRELLRELVPDDASIQYSDHFVASGKEIFNAVKELGLEGIVSKRAKAPYRSGKSANWLKTKNYAEVELPILGVVQEAGKPTLLTRQCGRPDLHWFSVSGHQQAQPRPVLAGHRTAHRHQQKASRRQHALVKAGPSPTTFGAAVGFAMPPL